MLQEMIVAFDQAEESVGAECLHQSLHGAEAQGEIELTVDSGAVSNLLITIVSDQFHALSVRKIDIWIVEERGEIVRGKTRTHSLKIDQVSRAVSDETIPRFPIRPATWRAQRALRCRSRNNGPGNSRRSSFAPRDKARR